MIEQKMFSRLIREFLNASFPEFIPSIKYQDNDSFDCSLKSISNVFSIWIATYNSEITIGLEDPEGNTDIHTHISCYEIEDLQSCTLNLATLINEIKNGILVLYKKEDGKYDWTESSKFNNLKGYESFSWNS